MRVCVEGAASLPGDRAPETFLSEQECFLTGVTRVLESQELQGEMLLLQEAQLVERSRHYCVRVCKREMDFSTWAKAHTFSVCRKRQTHGHVCGAHAQACVCTQAHTEGAGYSLV